MNPHHVSEALSAVAEIRDQRIATLEAELATAKHQAKQALEERAALAAALSAVYGVLENIQELNPSNYDHEQVCDLNSKMVEAWLCIEGGDHRAILAAHDAEVARKAKVEALEEAASVMTGGVRFTVISTNPDGSGDEGYVSLAKIRARIAALKAEGGKG